jgi:hypothetical protein
MKVNPAKKSGITPEIRKRGLSETHSDNGAIP